MKKMVLSVIFLLTVGVSAHAADIEFFEGCYKQRADKIPSKEERAFLDSYLVYLKNGTKANGEMAIQKMQELAKKQGGKFSTEWVSIFEGAMALCCGGPATCSESFGSTSLNILYPRVEKGWITAINIVQMYRKLAKTDGADAEGLEEYMKVIKEKHPWGLSLFRKKYKDN